MDESSHCDGAKAQQAQRHRSVQRDRLCRPCIRNTSEGDLRELNVVFTVQIGQLDCPIAGIRAVADAAERIVVGGQAKVVSRKIILFQYAPWNISKASGILVGVPIVRNDFAKSQRGNHPQVYGADIADGVMEAKEPASSGAASTASGIRSGIDTEQRVQCVIWQPLSATPLDPSLNTRFCVLSASS